MLRKEIVMVMDGAVEKLPSKARLYSQPERNSVPSHLSILMRIGLVSDTHGVFDQDLQTIFRGVALILHAGDVGHKGGHEEVRKSFQAIAPTLCVRGNVDEDAQHDRYPISRTVQDMNGWKILMTHICGSPPSKGVADLAKSAEAGIVLFGHSHKYSVEQKDSIWYINPGSAGPARFRLKRTAALLHLPPQESGEQPLVERIELKSKAPSRAK